MGLRQISLFFLRWRYEGLARRPKGKPKRQSRATPSEAKRKTIRVASYFPQIVQMRADAVRGGGLIPQIAPLARQMAWIFSHAESVSISARLTARPEGAEVHSPAASEATPWVKMLPCSLRPVRAKVLKQSVLCLLLPLQGVA